MTQRLNGEKVVVKGVVTTNVFASFFNIFKIQYGTYKNDIIFRGTKNVEIMSKGKYLVMRDDRLWFERSIGLHSDSFEKSPETKDGIEFTGKFSSEEKQREFENTFKNSSDVKILY